MSLELQLFEAYKIQNPNELTSQQFLNLEHELKDKDPFVITDEYLDFKLWYSGLPSRQETFAKYLLKKLPTHEGAKILEIGCGRTAILSRILSQKGFNMTCIDPRLELESNKIVCIKSKFEHNNFDLTPYDYIIAQEPCDATEHVVRACVNQNKPFTMSLCGVPHKLLCGKMPKTANEWHKYLQNICPSELKLINISFDPFTKSTILRKN